MSYRERINLTIDSSLLSQFKNYCKNKNINMSRLIEKHMKEEIRN
ncbi:type II toxin-antitoxin system CcdA family antitoxin [Candidatus Woesearchaeota archaeon]|nr:type II toxin-antitoxin system CcdA family antitoxin [Candidatus Woesearchaeota archaeon]